MLMKCPSTSAAIAQAARELKCDAVSSVQYHCMRDQHGQLLQKCLSSSWIQKGYCVEYNTDANKIDAKKCEVSFGICPQKTYLSNEVVSYSGCVKPKIMDAFTTIASTDYNATDQTLDSFNDLPTQSLPSYIVPTVIIFILLCVWVMLCWRYGMVIVKIGQCDVEKRGHGSFEDLEQEASEACKLLPFENPDQKQRKRNGDHDITERKIKGEVLRFFPNEIFCETKASKDLAKNIKVLKHVALVGIEGSGKTSIAWNTCENFLSQKIMGKECEVMVLKNLTRYPTLDPSKTSILILDDMFEDTLYSSKAMMVHLHSIDDFVKKYLSDAKQVVFIMTISWYAYTQNKGVVDNHPFFKTLTVIDLSSTEYDLSENEKEGILYSHGLTIETKETNSSRSTTDNMFRLPLKKMNDICKIRSKARTTVGFPLTAALFCRSEYFFDIGPNFFMDPVKHIRKRIKNLASSEKDKSLYLTLIYAMLKGGSVDLAKTDTDSLKPLAKTMAIKTAVKPRLPEDLFYTTHENKAEIYHKMLLKMALVSFGENNLESLLRESEISNVMAFIRVKPQKKKELNEYQGNGLLVVQPSNYMLLAKWVTELKHNDHIMFEDKSFYKKYESLLTEKMDTA